MDQDRIVPKLTQCSGDRSSGGAGAGEEPGADTAETEDTPPETSSSFLSSVCVVFSLLPLNKSLNFDDKD